MTATLEEDVRAAVELAGFHFHVEPRLTRRAWVFKLSEKALTLIADYDPHSGQLWLWHKGKWGTLLRHEPWDAVALAIEECQDKQRQS